jgi:branched-chain amino acid transport system permease protein
MNATHTRIRLALVVLVLATAALPLFVSDFNIERVAAEVLMLSILAMSFIFLTSLVGMVSLAQTAIAAAAGYSVAYGTAVRHWPVALTIVVAMLFGCAVGAAFGLVATRTSGIYFLVITLAMGLVVNKFALQNRGITNGSTGINSVRGPNVAGLNLDNGFHRFYVLLFVAIVVYAGLQAISRSHFGSTLVAIRDNPTRMRSLGYAVQLHRVAAFLIAAFIASISGIFGVWFRGRIDPTSASLSQAINLLVICVLGGLNRLEGAFVGAAVFVLLRTYASDVTDRFNTLIGLALLVVALLAPNGISGVARRVAEIERNRRNDRNSRLSTPVS